MGKNLMFSDIFVQHIHNHDDMRIASQPSKKRDSSDMDGKDDDIVSQGNFDPLHEKIRVVFRRHSQHWNNRNKTKHKKEIMSHSLPKMHLYHTDRLLNLN